MAQPRRSDAPGIDQARADVLGGEARAILDAIQDCVCVLDRAGRVTYANRRAIEHWKGDGGDVLGLVLWDRFPALRDSAIEAGARRALAGQRDSCEFISPITSRWLAVDFTPLPDGAALAWRDLGENRHLARQLHASDQALLMAQEAGGIGTFVWDLRTGEINWSPGMFRVLGIDPETPSQERYQAWLRVLHPADRVSVTNEEGRRRSTPPGPFAREFRVLRPDGEIRWVFTQGIVVWDEDAPSGMFGFDIDITERKRMEAALRESEARFRGVFKQSPLGTATIGSDARFREVNPALCGMLGYPEHELIGRSYLDLVHPDDRDACRRHARALVRGEVPSFQTEERYIQKSGATLWLSVNVGLIRDGDGNPLYSLAIFEDVSERKRITEALRESQESLRQLNDRLEQEAERRARQLAESRARLQVLFDASLDWLSLLRAEPDGRFVCVDVNPACLRALGLPRRNVVGRQITEVLGAEQAPAQLERLRACIADGEPQRLRTHPVVRGKRRTIDVMYVPVPQESPGGERLVVATAHDLTEREELEAQLRQIQKLDALGQLTGGIAHDFNNLLAAVLGSLELASRTVAEPRAVRHVQMALQAAQRGARLTAQMLAFSRKQDLVMRPVEANAVIGGIKELLTRTLGLSIAIETDLAPDLWLATADPVQLEVVLLNLALNARDAMPEGGVLRFATRNVVLGDPPPTGEPGGLAPGDYVQLAVHDTGQGMAEEVRAKAFEPFFTTKGPGKGTGLGLAQVFGFARQAGGTATVESAPGHGATVRVYLPRSDVLLAMPTGPIDPRAAVAAASHRILLVDDDDAVRALAHEMLAEAGHAVTGAGSGGDALRLLAGAEPFDLLVLDYAMPGMTGAEVATAARQLRPGLPILFMTGYVDTNALRPWVSSGCRVLNKPFQSEELMRAVEDAVRIGAAHDPAPE